MSSAAKVSSCKGFEEIINKILEFKVLISFGPPGEKTCRWCLQTTKALASCMISTFVIPFLESIIPKLATSDFSIF